MTISLPKFQQFAHSYDKATPIQSAVALFLARQIATIQAKTPAHQIWLDVGCGTGKLSQALIQQLGDDWPFDTLYGVDNSQAMLEIWAKNGALGRDNIAVPVLADMTALPFKAHTVDALISSFALHWATPQVIFELGSVVKPGGSMYLAIPVKGSFGQVKERFPQLPIYPFLASDNWQQAIEQLAKQRQGQLHFCETHQFSYRYPNLKNLLSELKHMGGAVSAQSPIAPAVLRQYLADDQPIDLTYRLLIVGVMLN